MTIPKEIEGYFTSEGVLHTWPGVKKASAREGVLAVLAGLLEEGKEYGEIEVNTILKPDPEWLDERAREMRRQPTPAERTFWRALRAGRVHG